MKEREWEGRSGRDAQRGRVRERERERDRETETETETERQNQIWPGQGLTGWYFRCRESNCKV